MAWILVIVLPVFGMAHGSLLPGDFHWVIQVLHLGIGLAGIAIANTLVDEVEP